MSTKHPAISPRRDGYIRALIAQKCLAVAFRHAGMLRIFEDNDPLARVYRALNAFELRYWLSVTPTRLYYAFLSLPKRERLLLHRFRAMLLEYRQHGFSFDAFIATPIGQLTSYLRPKRRQIAQCNIKHSRHHSPIPTTPKPHSSSPSPAPAGSH